MAAGQSPLGLGGPKFLVVMVLRSGSYRRSLGPVRTSALEALDCGPPACCFMVLLVLLEMGAHLKPTQFM